MAQENCQGSNIVALGVRIFFVSKYKFAFLLLQGYILYKQGYYPHFNIHQLSIRKILLFFNFIWYNCIRLVQIRAPAPQINSLHAVAHASITTSSTIVDHTSSDFSIDSS